MRFLIYTCADAGIPYADYRDLQVKPLTEPAGAWCADCGAPIGHDARPPDGWQLEDGRTVCHACCVQDTCKL